MRYGRYGWSYLCLRIGLGTVFLWIGIDIWRHPETWLGFLPADLGFGVEPEAALSAVSAFDAVLGVLLILNVWPRMMSFLAVMHLLGILAGQGIDAVLIRDVGLLGAAAALLFWPRRYHRRRWQMRLPWPLRRGGSEYEE
ncbi:MAG: DoxX family membrane protein [Candidatus Andersenbacteria bacterium]|nr:DoxX family membrane protein [Candidatus Andersenbacteria bacterium]